jgi:hypothetical protein
MGKLISEQFRLHLILKIGGTSDATSWLVGSYPVISVAHVNFISTDLIEYPFF